MTNDPTSPNTPEPQEPSPVADAMADAREALNRAGFSTPSGMVALAGLILIVAWFLFDLLRAEYELGFALLGVAAAAAIVYFGKGAYNRIAPEDAILKLLGMVITALAAFSIVFDLRFASGNLNDLAEILGTLFVAAAGVLAFLGARAID